MATSRLILLAGLLLAGACADQNVHTMPYASMTEARGAGAVANGWVPEWLPPDAYELRAAYDLDSHRRWGILNFAEGSADALRAVLEPDETEIGGLVVDIPQRIEWWPVALRGRLNGERLTTTGLRSYRVRGTNFVVAVNWNQGRAYYWALEP